MRNLVLPGLLLTLGGGAAASADRFSSADYAAGDDWPYYHGSPAGTHYSNLKDINSENVGNLKLAWTYDTGDKLGMNATIESNPLIVDGQLFFISPAGRLISLDGATGRERWTFDPGVRYPAGLGMWKRGVSYWGKGHERRIFFTFGADLYAVNADTGRAIRGFGSQGRVTFGGASSPGAVYKDLIVMGGGASGIRAFDVRSGALRWTFNTIPRPSEFGYDTWPAEAWKTASGVKSWAGMAIDTRRGMVFAPLSFPQDYYGAQRAGDNLFANCLLALDAVTGRRIWHFQTVRHDLWDRDLPAQPTLVTVLRNGKVIDAVAQVSKVGFVYVLDRLTGRSLFPLIEKPTIPSDIPGEVVAKTQLEPLLPVPFARQHLTADQLTRRTPEAAAAAAATFATLRSRGLWDPPSEQGTIVFPGLDGGAEWGAAAFDPETGLLYVNANEMAWILRLRKRSESSGGAELYQDYCAACHGKDRKGQGDFPSLIGIGDRLSFDQIVTKIAKGGGRMPPFASLAADQQRLWAVIQYAQMGIDMPIGIEPGRTKGSEASHSASEEEYVLDGYPRFLDPEGYPAISPPWGTLNAINLNTGGYVWKIPFGEYPELVARGLRNTGSENYGGPIVTAGGLLFIGATSFDKKFRAYEKHTGKVLWETRLPAAGNATPATYRAEGRQFVVIAAGGGRPPQTESGTKIVAFALP